MILMYSLYSCCVTLMLYNITTIKHLKTPKNPKKSVQRTIIIIKKRIIILIINVM